MSINLPNPGNLLKTKREALQLTRENVAAQLHYSLRIIRDLEENTYPKNSSMVFMKGYLRSYGRFLHIPEALLLEHFELFMNSGEKILRPDDMTTLAEELNTPSEQTFHFNFLKKSKKIFSFKLKWGLLFVFLFFITLFYFKNFYHYRSETIQSNPSERPHEVTTTPLVSEQYNE